VTSTPSELLPVNQSVFQVVAETNGSFEKLIADLEALQQVSFFPNGKLADYANVICRLRAEINLTLIEVLQDREMSNAGYFDRLCIEREQELKDPDDVLLDAELRKKQIADEQAKKDQQEATPQENPT
jgi:hypothetical protein